MFLTENGGRGCKPPTGTGVWFARELRPITGVWCALSTVSAAVFLRPKPGGTAELFCFRPCCGTGAFIFWSNGSRARAAFRRPCPVLLDLSSLTYASKPASSASKIPRTLFAEMCFTVFSERIFVQARHWPQVILDVLPRTITKHGRKTARKNRYGFDTRWTKEK